MIRAYNDIGVATATKWRHYPFYLQLYFLALETVHENFLLQSIGYSHLGVHEVKAKSVLERYRDILGWSFYG